MPISYSNPIDRLPKCENDDVWLFFCQRGYDGRSIVRMRTCTLKHNQTKSDSAVPAGLSMVVMRSVVEVMVVKVVVVAVMRMVVVMVVEVKAIRYDND